MEKSQQLLDADQDPWIFREGGRTISGRKVVRQISDQIGSSTHSTVDALIQAGELETALIDATHPSASVAAALTDELASALCSGERKHLSGAELLLPQIDPPESVTVSPPEGFTYYALHPLDFARVAMRLPESPNYAVVGIRSIGTTLSAVTTAALRLTGRRVSRITVRPTGHPYSRTAEFNLQQTEWIRENLSRSSHFLIIDEGPGRSGSTFLSVGEALLRTGVPRDKITLVGSRWTDPKSLCAHNAAARWASFNFISTSPSAHSRFDDCLYAGGGTWRDILQIPAAQRPESWTEMERLKFISPDLRTLFKFEGMGRIGSEVRQRAFVLGGAGFGPKAADAGEGFLAYELLHGHRLTVRDLNDALMDRMAEYCAYRANDFVIQAYVPNQLQQMVEFNVQQEFGIQLTLSQDEFMSESPIVSDGRMQPHEWIAVADDNFIKTDGADHGDNHFFPGPCDITWDLAGAAVEWELDRDALEGFLRHFRRHSGNNVSSRIASFMLAYTIFRLGFCRMALSTAIGSAEEHRLRRAAAKYRCLAKNLAEAKQSANGDMSVDFYGESQCHETAAP